MVKPIKLLALDIDGVLTDGRTRLGARPPEKKRLAFQDLDAINAAKRAGFSLALVTGESDGSVDLVAARTGVTLVRRGAKDKVAALKELAGELNISLEEICFVGDGNRDAPALACVGLAFAPANATHAARGAAHQILQRSGGHGAVAEAVRLLLHHNESGGARKDLQRLLQKHWRKHSARGKSIPARILAVLVPLADELIRVANSHRKLLLWGEGAEVALAELAQAKLPVPVVQFSSDPEILSWQLPAVMKPGDVIAIFQRTTKLNHLWSNAEKFGVTTVFIPEIESELSTVWRVVSATVAEYIKTP